MARRFTIFLLFISLILVPSQCMADYVLFSSALFFSFLFFFGLGLYCISEAREASSC